MTRIQGPAVSAPTAQSGTPEEQRLRAVAKQLEGVFVQELFKAMRETVPKDGFTDGGAGESLFTGMMDERIAMHVPERWDRCTPCCSRACTVSPTSRRPGVWVTCCTTATG